MFRAVASIRTSRNELNVFAMELAFVLQGSEVAEQNMTQLCT